MIFEIYRCVVGAQESFHYWIENHKIGICSTNFSNNNNWKLIWIEYGKIVKSFTYKIRYTVEKILSISIIRNTLHNNFHFSFIFNFNNNLRTYFRSETYILCITIYQFIPAHQTISKNCSVKFKLKTTTVEKVKYRQLGNYVLFTLGCAIYRYNISYTEKGIYGHNIAVGRFL